MPSGIKPYLRACLLWVSIVVLAVALGAFRELVLHPRMGAFALPAGGLLLMCGILLTGWVGVPHLQATTRQSYWRIGLLWAVLTVLFELTFGLLTGSSLDDLLHAYDLTTGNLWTLIVIVTGMTPPFVARQRKLY